MPETPDAVKKFQRIGVVGAGNMGSMIALAFAEIGLEVSVWDAMEDHVDQLAANLENEGTLKNKVQCIKNVDEFTKSLEGCGGRKLFIFSISHGNAADSVLSKIKGDLKKGDIILDGGNEHYRNTERRQRECGEMGVTWIGMGVSGGYQSARHGPSMSPGGDPQALEEVLPLLELYAAKDPKSGTPCVGNMGPRGAGHYVKMVHNGIEVGMLSIVCETWSILRHGLGLNYEEIGDIFAQWNDSGELRRNYLIKIAADVSRTKKTPKGDRNGEGASADGGYVLDDVLDKVVQDDDDTEGTPAWSISESSLRHISSPTLAAGYYLRVASGNREERLQVAENMSMPGPKPFTGQINRETVIKNLHAAVYSSFLSSFCQGLELIARASHDEGWDIDLAKCIQIWRAGCIIQSEHIADLLQPLLSGNKHITNIKTLEPVARDLQGSYHALKEIVVEGSKADHYVPAISASLEYVKYTGGTKLPTQFMEAEMDYFGAHSYNQPGVPGEDPGPTSKGPHHYEWRPA